MNALEQAKAYIRSTLGLSDNPNDWTYDERVSYNRALATYIQNNATSFSAQSVDTANAISSENSTALDDTGFLSSLSVFGDEFLNQAERVGDSVAQIGEGTISFFNMGKWLVPLLGLTAIGLLIFVGFRKAKAA